MKRQRNYIGLSAILLLLMVGCGTKESLPAVEDSLVQDINAEIDTITDEKLLDPNWFLVKQEEQFADYTTGTFVAGYNALDYGADPTGKEDNTEIFQMLMDSLGELGGGTLYVPNGMYRCDGFLTVPKGVTIRGDWKKPEKNKAIEGTVLMAYAGRGMTNEELPFITLVLGSGAMDVTIWYPEQDPADIRSYSPAITMGQQGYFGNEYNNVKNVTLVNAYTGVQFSYVNSGACPIISGVYGTPLGIGVEIDNIADVGRIEHVEFSPSYWISCGLYERLGIEDPFSDSGVKEKLSDYLYQNATGINMRRNDWSYTCYVDVEGYRYGYRAMKTANKDSDSVPNGQQYGMNFRNCQTGISIAASANAGIMFAYLDIQDCENGFVIESSATGPVQVQGAKISTSDQAICIADQSSALLLMNECIIEKGTVIIDGGILDIVDSNFQNATKDIPHISIGLSGRVNMVGNHYNGERNVVNKSLYVSNISDEDVQMEKLPEYVETTPKAKLPASMCLYLVTDYGAVADGVTDCTDAVRAALADAADGGGIVFFPSGHYRFDDTLTVPTGVELRGACDNSVLPHGEGTILEVYCGEGDVNAEPFLQLKEGSGIRGLSINYPNQIYTGTKPVEPDYAPVPYPYTIQGQGKDIYIINVGLRASYLGVDLFTYSCDNHYVDFITGQMFQVSLRIGNSKNGEVRNMQCNTIAYACGHESKFGSFPNSPAEGISNQPIYDYTFYNLDNVILGDCENEFLYNDFNFGAYRGIVFIDEGNGGAKNGLAIGLALDKDCRGLYFDEGLSGANFQFINTQIVSTEADEETEYLYGAQNSDFDMVIHGGDFWGNPSHFVKMEENSGNLILQNGRTCHPGRSTFAILNGGNFALKASSSDKMSGVVKMSENSRMDVRACVLRNTRASNDVCIWTDNVLADASISDEGGGNIFLSRADWTADASPNSGSAKNALDGDTSTRWDTSNSQKPGQWFLVDTNKESEFNCILLDFSGSPNDAPADFEIYVSNDGENWGASIASGKKGNGIIQVEPQHARYIKIMQNGTGGNYWSIHEFYLLNI